LEQIIRLAVFLIGLSYGCGAMDEQNSGGLNANYGRGVQHREPDGSGEIIPPTQARQGVISGRVLAVLLVSVFALGAIYAIMWLTHAQL
jgi:hypothetical protein